MGDHFRGRSFPRAIISEGDHFRGRSFPKADISEGGHFHGRTSPWADESGHIETPPLLLLLSLHVYAVNDHVYTGGSIAGHIDSHNRGRRPSATLR